MCENNNHQQLHVYCDINDIVSRYLIGAKIIPYISYRWYEVSKSLAKGFGSVVKHLTVGLRVLTPSLQLKLLKKEICTNSCQEKCSRVPVLYSVKH